ncbi:MAG: hypothetical protein HQL82_09685 [Magnetococcales bacterium]|nr:hypothetical protein [Magnetococcales bacterium]
MRSFILPTLGLTLLGATLAAPPALAAPWYGGPFSAEIVMSSSGDPANQASGRLFVGETALRAEGTHQGQTKAVIIDRTQGKAWTLLVDRKQYHEGISDAPMPPQPDIQDNLPGDPNGPCQTGQGEMQCQKMGSEAVNGIPTDKWQIVRNSQGRTMGMILWVDPQRRLILRRQAQNGPTMERSFQGMEQVNGRNAEKWEFTESFQNQSRRYTQWTDATLRIPLRMTGEQQFSAELRNVTEGPQNPELFQIPKDYQQIAPPQPPQQQGGGQQPQQGMPQR